jgi:hypothetical protein
MQARPRKQVYSSIFGFQLGLTLVSYVPTFNVTSRPSIKHRVITLVLDSISAWKPEIIENYNQWKGSVGSASSYIFFERKIQTLAFFAILQYS